ncbi:MAG: hypothetical protein Q8N85_03685 [Candidatus Omnitrophota bacterium]|nr:hypothetical protein [Candidatus Omnitrophota bacterium]
MAIIILAAGCARLKDAGKCFVGISTQALEDGRKKAVRKSFHYDYETCFTKVKAILKSRKTYIYAQDKAKGMIAIYVSELDTTAVGIFFKAVDAQNTEIEVSSSSTYAKETIAQEISDGLEGKLAPEGEEGTTDAKKGLLFN